MSPLAKKYQEKTKLREVECKSCGFMMATRMKIPRCGKCGTYTEEDRK
jgi:ribosomal protein S27AE